MERTPLERVVDRLMVDCEVVAGKRRRPMRRADLARKLGIGWSALCRTLAARNPHLESLRNIAEGLGVTGAGLLRLVEDEERRQKESSN